LLETMKNQNIELESTIKNKEGYSLPRAAAFNLAPELEESAGEIYFQHAMHETEHPSGATKLFQRLKGADMDHADRIRSYVRHKGIGFH